MKYYESTFNEYIESVIQNNYHPELLKKPKSTQVLALESIATLPNTIYYGPAGVGKYSQMLSHIASMSPTQLKYQRRMNVETEKGDYSLLFSDIHYEVDMGLLGCNSKIIWDAVFNQIVEMISIKPSKQGILVCKNFHQIHSELLDIFFIYFKQFQQTQNPLFNKQNILLKFIIITEHLSFLPSSVVRACNLISVSRPTKQGLFMGTPAKIRAAAVSLDLSTISNLKQIRAAVDESESDLSIQPATTALMESVCQPLVVGLMSASANAPPLDILKIREHLYNISIYQLDVVECLWYLMKKGLAAQQRTKQRQSWGKLLQEIAIFLKYYNNNYRTIYHFESIYYSLWMFLAATDKRS